MSFVQGRGIGDALRALLRRKGIDQQMGRADEPVLHGGGGLNGHQLVHQIGIDAAAELRQGFRSDKLGWRGLRGDFPQATGIHHRHIGAQALTDRFVGLAQLVFEQFQG